MIKSRIIVTDATGRTGSIVVTATLPFREHRMNRVYLLKTLKGS
jgi:hypothetical protein